MSGQLAVRAHASAKRRRTVVVPEVHIDRLIVTGTMSIYETWSGA